MANKLDRNWIYGFTVGVPVTNGTGHVDYGRTMAGSGWSLTFTNHLAYTIGITSIDATGFDFALYDLYGSLANITVPEYWISGIVYTAY